MGVGSENGRPGGAPDGATGDGGSVDEGSTGDSRSVDEGAGSSASARRRAAVPAEARTWAPRVRRP
ncbi:hypothetical protein [Streptomyces sp. NBC_00648]|uniref:hypothetical protein n=1 Tax=Streptomyces sp. NBC_00648 TaxID=2975797 RepID=UPI0032542E2B